MLTMHLSVSRRIQGWWEELMVCHSNSLRRYIVRLKQRSLWAGTYRPFLWLRQILDPRNQRPLHLFARSWFTSSTGMSGGLSTDMSRSARAPLQHSNAADDDEMDECEYCGYAAR